MIVGAVAGGVGIVIVAAFDRNSQMAVGQGRQVDGSNCRFVAMAIVAFDADTAAALVVVAVADVPVENIQ